MHTSKQYAIYDNSVVPGLLENALCLLTARSQINSTFALLYLYTIYAAIKQCKHLHLHIYIMEEGVRSTSHHICPYAGIKQCKQYLLSNVNFRRSCFFLRGDNFSNSSSLLPLPSDDVLFAS